MFSKRLNELKDKAKQLTQDERLLSIKDKGEEVLEQSIANIQSLVREQLGPRARDIIENDELMEKALSRAYDVFIVTHPLIRLAVRRERFINFCLKNRTRLIEKYDSRKQLTGSEQYIDEGKMLPSGEEQIMATGVNTLGGSMESFEDRSRAEMASAPRQFSLALASLGHADPRESLEAFAALIPLLKESGGIWYGASYCCYAYCLKQLEQYQEALAYAEQGRRIGLGLTGYWYYYDVVVSSFNFTDDLPNALRAADNAIQFFHAQGSSGNKASQLGWKANILKQLASPLSLQPNSRESAKNYIIQAIEAICESLWITCDGLEEVTEELSAIARIAARVGVQPDELASLEKMDRVQPIIHQYFSPGTLKRMAVSDCRNLSVVARKNGNREEAAIHLRRALEIAPEETENDRAFKAFLAYEHGVNLLKLSGLEQYRAEKLQDLSIRRVAEEIRDAWGEGLRLYSTISSEGLSDFNRNFVDLTEAVRSIKCDPLMSEWSSSPR
jgi:tetratricopeptide (TPR) repeat protein